MQSIFACPRSFSFRQCKSFLRFQSGSRGWWCLTLVHVSLLQSYPLVPSAKVHKEASNEEERKAYRGNNLLSFSREIEITCWIHDYIFHRYSFSHGARGGGKDAVAIDQLPSKTVSCYFPRLIQMSMSVCSIENREREREREWGVRCGVWGRKGEGAYKKQFVSSKGIQEDC